MTNHPMPGSVADDLRRALSPEARGICEALDRQLARAFPEPASDETEAFRDGRRTGIMQAISLIERKEWI